MVRRDVGYVAGVGCGSGARDQRPGNDEVCVTSELHGSSPVESRAPCPASKTLQALDFLAGAMMRNAYVRP